VSIKTGYILLDLTGLALTCLPVLSAPVAGAWRSAGWVGAACVAALHTQWLQSHCCIKTRHTTPSPGWSKPLNALPPCDHTPCACSAGVLVHVSLPRVPEGVGRASHCQRRLRCWRRAVAGCPAEGVPVLRAGKPRLLRVTPASPPQELPPRGGKCAAVGAKVRCCGSASGHPLSASAATSAGAAGPSWP